MATPHKLLRLQPNQLKPSEIFFDLGKPTKRGTKKCPDCGYTNGTKSYTCKNTFCNRILKPTDHHKIQIDAIKLITGRNRQIYSVRACARSHNLVKQRGFVQLPCTIFERDKLSEAALCFVAHCERSYSILKCHENNEDEDTTAPPMHKFDICAHISAAVKSLTIAQGLEFKHDLINNLKACDTIKKKLCALANSSTEGPLVQCVARHVMAIKCFVNSAYPLGYLHFSLEVRKNASEEIDGFHCECTSGGKCLHYYACICAFASDVKYLQQYHSFVQQEFDLKFDLPSPANTKDLGYTMENIKIEILCSDLLDLQQMKNTSSNLVVETTAAPSTPADVNGTTPAENCRQPNELVKVLSNDLLQTSCFSTDIQPLTAVKETKSIDIPTNVLFSSEMLSYNEWLSSVIERINYSSASVTSLFFNELDDFCPSTIMDVNEVKLEFHIPEKFFQTFKRHLYDTMGNSTQDHCQIAASSDECGDFGVISTMHFTITDVMQLEQLFSMETVKLATYQLLVGVEWPFRIAWTGNLYKLSKFGELQLSFIRQQGND